MSFQIGAVNIGHLIKNVNINLFLPNWEEHTRKKDYWDKKYAGALSYVKMQQTYTSMNSRVYPQSYFQNIVLPYSLEMIFFEKDSLQEYFVEYNEIKVKYDPGNNLVVQPLCDKGVYTEEFVRAVERSFAESRRRWDQGINRALIKVGKIDKKNKQIEIGRTTYNSQVYTNLSMDIPRTKTDIDTLRTETSAGGCPPSLDDQKETNRLANNLGIGVLVLTPDLFLVPLRSMDVAIFPEEWGSSCGFAGGWKSWMKGNSNLLSSTVNALLEEHLEWELKMDPGFIYELQPLALMREWLRGGKPELFMLATTKMTREQIIARLPEALHREEIKSRSKVLKYFGKEFVLMNEKNRDSYAPSIVYMMHYVLARDYLEQQNQ